MQCSVVRSCLFIFFFFNDTATTEIYTLSLHDALPIYVRHPRRASADRASAGSEGVRPRCRGRGHPGQHRARTRPGDRKSTRLNSSHANISYAVFCLKKKKNKKSSTTT